MYVGIVSKKTPVSGSTISALNIWTDFARYISVSILARLGYNLLTRPLGNVPIRSHPHTLLQALHG